MDHLSHKFVNNSRRNFDANESLESPDDNDVVPHLEEVNLAFVIVLRVVIPTGCVNREVDTLRVVADHVM